MMWNIENMIEVRLLKDFLVIVETLQRIGISSKKEKKLYQSCHILYKRGSYFIVHFKELFLLDGKTATLSDNDLARRNKIVQLLTEWNLVEPIEDVSKLPQVSLSQIKVIKASEKFEWILESKYTIGNKR